MKPHMSTNTGLTVTSLLLKALWNEGPNVIEAENEVEEAQKLRAFHQQTVNKLQSVVRLLEDGDEGECND